MFVYEKKLQYPVRITNPNPQLAAVIISQYGGPDGELGASLRYLSQRYSMPYPELKGLLTDIGTEELGHLEMVGTIVHQLTRTLTQEQIASAGFAPYFVDHTAGVYPQAASGTPWSAATMAVTGDPIADLTENLAAEQKARVTYDNILRISDDPDVNDAIRFLREREIVHFQRFGEALELLRQVSVKGGIGYIVEYCGDGVKELSISERQTIANMSIEIGATTGIFPSDERTREFLKAQRRESDYVPLQPEEGATYDKVVEIDLDRLEPLVAEPSMPDKVCTARKAEGVKPGSVFIGSCTNASYSDIARAACILKGHKVHKDIDCTVAPGSRQVLAQLIKDGVLADLVESGCRILECACGPCIGVGQVPPHNGISVRTSNRNFPGRCGSNDAYVYLASPETAAATAVTGHITDPRDLMDVSVLAKIQEPEAYIIDDSSLIAPEETADRHAVEVIKGPNISELPMRGPVRETIDAGIVLKLGDNITTDDIIPAGASILKYISNIPEFAKYTFCYTDPDFVDRARRMGHSVIVGGENYGQGSSREHAAMLPMCLGVEVVIAKSYARIHKENLFNYGILPLIFEDPADYEKLQQGDRQVLENVPEGIRAGRLTVTVPERGLTLTAVLEASDYDKNLLLEGGALNHLAKLQKR